MQVKHWLNNARATFSTHTRYQSLPSNGHTNGHLPDKPIAWKDGPSEGRSSCFAILHHRRARLVFIGLILSLVTLLVLGSVSSDQITTRVQQTVAAYRPHDVAEPEPVRPNYLRMLIPASQADAGLCKTVLSSAVLGYPAPILINWNKTFEDNNLIFGGSHIAKIKGVLEVLQRLDSSNDDDLVMVADGYDVWFQLRPNVLIERYFEVNNAANARLRKEHGAHAAAKGIQQKVIFSSQKKCWPEEGNNPMCFALPESTLSRDVYGEGTDTEGDSEENQYFKYRQQYLNSGTCIGTVSAVRAIFERADEKMAVSENFGSDQGIFAEIFGEQEFMRHVLKYQARNIIRRIVDIVSRLLGMSYSYKTIDLATKDDRVALDVNHGDPLSFEFGIGLDYESKISLPTVFAEQDTEWIERRDRENITTISKEKGIPLPPRVGNLPQEVIKSLQPFYSSRRGYYEMSRLPVKRTWNQVPLLTNMWTGISPVAVHHNAHRNGLKSRIQEHWPYAWYQPYLRSLLDARALSPQHQVAVTYNNGSEQAWYSPTYESWNNEFGGVYTDSGQYGRFDQLCGVPEIWDELFRDGKGSWDDPRFREPRPSALAESSEEEQESEDYVYLSSFHGPGPEPVNDGFPSGPMRPESVADRIEAAEQGGGLEPPTEPPP